MEAAFYWPDYQNFLTFKALWENQKLGREFEKLDRVLEKLGRVFEKSCRVFLSIYLYIYLTLAKWDIQYQYAVINSFLYKNKMLIKANGAIKSTRPVLSQSATVHNSHITHWSRGHMRSHDQLKTKYPLLCKAYGHKTWKICSFWWGKLTHGQPGEVMWRIKRFISPIPQTCDHQT